MMVKKHLRLYSKSKQIISVSDTFNNESKMWELQKDISDISKFSEKEDDSIFS